MLRLLKPYVVELAADLALPSTVRGPVDFCALRRLASMRFWDDL